MIIFLGIAGAGKGTQADLLARRYNSVPLSTGEILRRYKNDKLIQKYLKKGELVPDKVLLPIVEKEIIKVGGHHNHIILDGFPRTMEQAQWVMKKVGTGEFRLNGMINLKIDPEKARYRLHGRARADDNDKTINERFTEYKKHILPIIGYFKAQGFRVAEINADQTIKKVAADIKSSLGE